MALTEKKYTDKEALNTAFSDTIAAILEQGIAQKGRASLLVSGGRTPQPMFAALSQKDLNWSKVDISLVDDRWVDSEHEASNESMVRQHLLVNNAAAARFTGLKTASKDARDAVQACTENLAEIHTPFDVLILGMGEDGHTASLFPCSQEVDAGLDLRSGEQYIAVTPTTAPHQRMSLTLPAILSSRNIFLHLTGEAKLEVLQQAQTVEQERDMPISAVLNRADVTLVWAP